MPSAMNGADGRSAAAAVLFRVNRHTLVGRREGEW